MAHTYLITGASSGFGTAMARAAQRQGHKVIGTARNVAKAKSSFPDIEKNGGIWLTLDVTQPDTEAIVKKCVEEHNVDVLINNSAYAIKGPLEDHRFVPVTVTRVARLLTQPSWPQIRTQWETNVFGVLACTRGALPTMRTRKSGTIVNISSTAGMRGVAGYSQYCGTKFAIEGVSEGLAVELAPFNIRVLIVEPGVFRTNFQAAAEDTPVSAAYAGTPADEVPKAITAMHGSQPGDPDKASDAIVQVVEGKGVGADQRVGQAMRMPLGKDAYKAGIEEADKFKADVELMKPISESVVFADA